MPSEPATASARSRGCAGAPDASTSAFASAQEGARRQVQKTPSLSHLRIERIVVKRGRMVCHLRLADGAPRESTPEVARRLAQRLPTLARHACVNERGTTFGAVMAHTPLPHVLEHLVIDLQVRAEAASSEVAASPDARAASAAPYVGTSEWVDEDAGEARVEVSFTDDVVALRAFRDAARILNDAVLP